MNIESLISEEALAIRRQREFPAMLRDVVAGGAKYIDICVEANTAIKIAVALELLNAFTLGDEE